MSSMAATSCRPRESFACPSQPSGSTVLRAEREFNRRAGFTEIHDRLPEAFSREPLPPHNTVFDVPAEEMAKVNEQLIMTNDQSGGVA